MLRAALTLVVLLLAGCAPSSRGDTIVLLGGDVFAEGDRCARLLDQLARTSDVFGDSRFVQLGEPVTTPTTCCVVSSNGPTCAPSWPCWATSR